MDIINTIKAMTDEELERNLITLDYKGMNFKKAALEELKKRVAERAAELAEPEVDNDTPSLGDPRQ